MNVSRYIDTTELKFEVEFITPAFLGGADGNAELRTAAFKHGMRYWWRILHGFKYGNRIKEVEDLIFGSTAQGSSIIISFSDFPKSNFTEKKGFPKGQRITVTHRGREMAVNILDYLAYGKYDYVRGSGNVYNSTYIKPNTKVSISISIKETGYTDEIKDALKMFILYGGVGSRSRNGFGSMNSDTLNIDFSKTVQLSKLKEYPIFSEDTKFFRSKKPSNTWEEALSEIGVIYKNARCSLEKQHQYEKRGYISRPIEVRGETIPNNIKRDRIPKPFYLGIKRYGEQFLGYILCLPILFYEKNNQADYMKQIIKMESHFSEELKNDTENFKKQLIGGAK